MGKTKGEDKEEQKRVYHPCDHIDPDVSVGASWSTVFRRSRIGCWMGRRTSSLAILLIPGLMLRPGLCSVKWFANQSNTRRSRGRPIHIYTALTPGGNYIL